MRQLGLRANEISEALEEMRAGDADWRSGRTWSLVYSAGDEHDSLIEDAYVAYFHENGLSPSAFPSLERMEREVVHDLLEHVGVDPETSGGAMTSGGTESIILAVKAYRDRSGIQSPSIVLPSTAHPAFMKACDLLAVEPIIVPIDASLRADPIGTADAIDASTIALVASAPAYPYGLVDPIADLGELAREHAIGLHIDACLGGIPLPFLGELGRPIPEFDFGIEGVTSMSVDLHKYGYAAKGASAVLYRDRELRSHQFTVFTDWPGGALASPTLLGTRPGGSIAAAWATLNAHGRDGYLSLFESIMKTTDRLIEGISSIGDLEVIGEPPMSVFAVSSETKDVFVIADLLEKGGWRIDRQADPDCLHHIVNPRHEAFVEQYLEDLRSAYDHAPAKRPTEGRQALYGVTSRIVRGSDLRAALLDDLSRRYDG